MQNNVDIYFGKLVRTQQYWIKITFKKAVIYSEQSVFQTV